MRALFLLPDGLVAALVSTESGLAQTAASNKAFYTSRLLAACTDAH
jgi:hypothetical protein